MPKLNRVANGADMAKRKTDLSITAIHHNALTTLAPIVALGLISGPAAAQDDAASGAVQPLIEEVVVTGEAIDIYDLLPDRETDSVFGTTRSLAETPRAVTLVESLVIDLFGIQTVNDFVAITPGSFTGNYFGVPGAIDLRGERADNFFRGFRRVENRGNFPTYIAAAEYVELIKGPPPTIYGGGKVGGILNFVPKSAESKTAQLIGEPLGAVSLTYGSYNKQLASAEFGLPFEIGDKPSGVYAVAQIENSEHFYRDIYNDNQVLQVAFDTEASDSIALEYGMMLQRGDLNQSLGWNRVTQELIDTEGGRYLAGSPALDLNTDGNQWLTPSEIEIYDLEQFAFTSPFPYDALTPEQQAAYALDPDTVRYTSLDHRTVQTELSDFSLSDVYTAYFDISYDPISEYGWTIKNQTFYDEMDHTKFSSYGFTADYDIYVIENKTTVGASFQPSSNVAMETVFGLAYRKSKGIEQESRGRGYQVLDRRDISAGVTPNDRFEGAYTGSGNVVYNWQQDGEFSDTGIFALVDTAIGERWTAILAARWDRYDVSVYGTDVAGVYDSASASEDASSYNASLSFAITPTLNLYTTYATSEYLELGQGGMIARENVAGGTWVQDSELTEVGMKGYLNDQKIYFSASLYEQEKTSFNNLSGSFDAYHSEGVELEARYAATENLSFTATATNQTTEIQNPPFFLGIPPDALGLDPALTYGGRFVGVGALVGFNGPVESPIPENMYSLNGVYTSDLGWGFSLGATYVDSMFAGYSQTIKLPSYTVARAAVFYEGENYSVRLNANNLFDEKYYTPQFLFWDVFVSPSVGRIAELTFTYNW